MIKSRLRQLPLDETKIMKKHWGKLTGIDNFFRVE